MITTFQRHVLRSTLTFALMPALAFSQTAERDAPFDHIGRRLKVGQTAEVVDNTGLRVKGKVTEIRGTRLVLIPTGTGRAGTRIFAAADVRIIRRVGSIWDGAAKGAIAGAAPWAFLSRNCYSCAEFAAISAAIGAGIGLGIDALFGPRTVYRARPSSSRVVNIVPTVSRDRKGLRAAIAF